jgi:hypothetical protein
MGLCYLHPQLIESEKKWHWLRGNFRSAQTNSLRGCGAGPEPLC